MLSHHSVTVKYIFTTHCKNILDNIRCIVYNFKKNDISYFGKEKKSMFANLRRALFDKNISIKSYAEFLGITEKTAQNKLNGTSEFTFSEVEKTTRILFPEFNWTYEPESIGF